MRWRSSYLFVIFLAITIGLATIGSSILLDLIMHRVVRQLYASDLLEAVVATILSAVAMVRMQRRRREMLTRLQIVEDVNHHVRNALTAVTLSASLGQDTELIARVRDASERIDWVLRDILPNTVRAQTLEASSSKWSSGLKYPTDH